MQAQQMAYDTACDNIIFPELKFTSPGVYLFWIQELTASSFCWKTDGSVYRVVVTVVYNSAGVLEAHVLFPDGEPIFINCKYMRCREPWRRSYDISYDISYDRSYNIPQDRSYDRSDYPSNNVYICADNCCRTYWVNAEYTV